MPLFLVILTTFGSLHHLQNGTKILTLNECACKVKPNEFGSLTRNKSHFTREGILFHGFCQGYWSRRLLPALICNELKPERDLIFFLRNGKEGVRIIFWNNTFWLGSDGISNIWSVALHSFFQNLHPQGRRCPHDEECNILYADLKRKLLRNRAPIFRGRSTATFRFSATSSWRAKFMGNSRVPAARDRLRVTYCTQESKMLFL